MKLLTFKGGIHPPYGKEYANKKPIEKAAAPAKVYIPLQQHIGAPAKCIVAVGDEVNWVKRLVKLRDLYLLTFMRQYQV